MSKFFEDTMQGLLEAVEMEKGNITMAAKQAVREQALPFQPNLNKGSYSINAYKLAMRNTKYNESGKAVIENDDWKDETEWDDMFHQMKGGIENE